MVEVEFNYQQNIIKIQANINDRFQLIIEKYLNKINLDINNIYFLSNGKKISKDDILGNIMNESDKRNNKIIILVYTINIIKSNEIICPICKEICKYEIKDYKIKLYDCKNGHIIEDIKLNEFVNKQNIDISEIKCDNCKEKNKSNTKNNDNGRLIFEGEYLNGKRNGKGKEYNYFGKLEFEGEYLNGERI